MDRVAVETMGLDALSSKEWLVANHLGGFATSTICGMNTRKYHGLLVAAMAPPVRRMVILSRVDERVITRHGIAELSCNEYPETIHPRGDKLLRAFSTDPFPRWAYQADGFTLERSLHLLDGENTVCLSYTLLTADEPVELDVRPLLALRGIHELMYQWNGRLFADASEPRSLRIAATSRTPEVFFAHDGEFVDSPVWYLNNVYRREQDRGYGGLEDLWMPGLIRRHLAPGESFHLACSMERCDLDRAISLSSRRPEAETAASGGRELADLKQAAALHVCSIGAESGQKTTAIITHYPWSAPSLRGAMIGFAGLLLVPGEFEQARALLDSTAALAEDGIIPSLLPEDGSQPVYHGADVSLWFINALHQYWTYTADEVGTRWLLEVADKIIECYRAGTKLGIAADSEQLIVAGQHGMPVTWMDAQVVDWIVTRRQGRAVEINALWHNALRIVAELHRRIGRHERSRELGGLGDIVQRNFNERFWNEKLHCLYDVVEDRSVDASVRPNQLFAVSLPFPAVWRERQGPILDRVYNDLLTPLGVRTLSPHDGAYQGRYRGNVISRDKAYHQGSAYPWLLGPLVSGLVRVRGRTQSVVSLAKQILKPAIAYIQRDGMGMICELFDGDYPQRPGGALASAPAAGELLRAWAEDVLGLAPPAAREAAGSEGPAVAAAK